MTNPLDASDLHSEVARLDAIEVANTAAVLAMLADEPRRTAELVAFLFDEDRRAAELAELLAAIDASHDL